MRIKDILVRDGQWDRRSQYMGRELRDRTFGAIGLGGIARKTIALLKGFGMKQPVAYDPYVAGPSPPAPLPPGERGELSISPLPPGERGRGEGGGEIDGVRLTSLDELLTTADFVSIHCPLTDQTRNLIGARELALMKPDAYLINTARGGIVNEGALYEALRQRRIAGAAIDCFADEPVVRPHPFGALDNVLLAPHSIAWTHELFRDIGRAVCQGMVDLSQGKRPRGVVNPQVFERRGLQEKWARLRAADPSPLPLSPQGRGGENVAPLPPGERGKG
jgi:phosphoglycerate dehydrogenase-like enzyme